MSSFATLFGRVISGLQYGANWQAENISFIANGQSHIPPDIACFPIEEGNNSGNRYAYYTQNTFSPAQYANFDNWLSSSGTLPNAGCDNTQTLVEADDRSKEINYAENAAWVFPNPFVQNFSLELQLKKAQSVALTLYASNGQEVHQTIDEFKEEGRHLIPIVLSDNASDGIYWISIQLEQETIVKRIVRQKK